MATVAYRLLPAFDPAQSPHETVPCNLCGGRDTRLVAQTDRYGLIAPTVECRACGLQYLNPRMTPEAYRDFYAHHYRDVVSQAVRVPYTKARVRADQREYLKGLLADVAAIVEPYPGSHIVDLGGSTGLVGQAYADAYVGLVTVIDPCAAELADAAKAGHRTICATAETAEIEPGSADVVLLCRTIEHLCDPMAVLRRIRHWMSDRGYLVVDAMNTARWPKAWRYKIDHPYAFTPETFERMVTTAGWTIRGRWTRREGLYMGLVCSPKERHGTDV